MRRNVGSGYEIGHEIKVHVQTQAAHPKRYSPLICFEWIVVSSIPESLVPAPIEIINKTKRLGLMGEENDLFGKFY